ncbi:steroidogenic acute regulatory protein-like [Diorhabda carinulata]|uniref:steroidogenic acute regulatory protein-like n=1 Tax=Diorhabda carinulata TaxID=1163345 RepID=UPI0025A1736A|nr:steroidogenic acute regulatory protein-like [Diorhabda carinulata]
MTTPDQENVLNYNQSESNNAQSPLDVSYSYSVNTAHSVRDYIISEDLLAGQRTNGRMSNIRRFFCLFVTFDFLFTSLMWIICVMLDGQYIIKALTEQVIHYNIQTSLFDIVLVAFCRFCMLTIFYAALYKSHWIIISITTAGTCGFLIAKVLYFDWPHSSQPVFEVLLVLVSFILAWGEAWFLDFRVIPQENYANRYVIAGETERTPLIRSYVQGLPSVYTESVGNFYSPQGSPEGSLYRVEQTNPPRLYNPVRLSRKEEHDYKKLASATVEEAWNLFKNSLWTLHTEKNNDKIFVSADRNNKKIFKLQAVIDASPQYLVEELYYKECDMTKWNTSVKETYKIQTIDEYTDITYTISKDSAKGLVSSRDFVNLRRFTRMDNAFVIFSCKTEHPSVPKIDKITRGENGAGGFIIEEFKNDPNKCTFYWILNVDLKLEWVPNRLLVKEFSSMMFIFVEELRQYLRTKKSPRK